MCRVVAYYRVSTEGQGRSRLGLEAQQEAVKTLCDQRGWEIIAEFTGIFALMFIASWNQKTVQIACFQFGTERR